MPQEETPNPNADGQEPESVVPEVNPEDSEEFDAGAAKKLIADLRNESASRRVKVRELEVALAAAKTPEEFAAATKTYSDQITELEREVIKARYKLPDSLAKRLVGTTLEELEADAKELAKLARPQADPEDLGGGLNPREQNSNKTVKAVIDRHRKFSHGI